MNNDVSKKIWDEKLESRLEYLSNLGEGWVDGDAGSTISNIVLERTKDLANKSYEAKTETPVIFPTEEGGTHLEWIFDNKEFYSVTINVDDTFELFYLALDDSTRSFKENSTFDDAVKFIEAMPKIYD